MRASFAVSIACIMAAFAAPGAASPHGWSTGGSHGSPRSAWRGGPSSGSHGWSGSAWHGSSGGSSHGWSGGYRGGYYGGNRGGYYGHSSFHFGLGWGPWYYPSYSYSPYYYPSTYVYAPSVAYPGPGSIDTDVVPSNATVYLDGQPVGVADDFDGWPAKLYTAAGQHELRLVMPGFETTSLQVNVVPGQTVHMDVHLRRLGPGEQDHAAAAPTRTEPAPAYREQQQQPATPPDNRRHEPRALTLDVRPMGAAIYVDGDFEGPAGAGPASVGGLSPGRHAIEVVKPGYRSYRGEVVVPDGDSAVNLTVRLEVEK